VSEAGLEYAYRALYPIPSVIRIVTMNMKVEAIRRAKQGLLEDEDLQALISERIEEDGSFWVAAGKFRTVINVEVTDGHVSLTGTVRSALDRRRADLLARALGAAGVENRLRIADGSPAPKRVA
jgi:osmotically-inducible protein OsmY